MNKELSKAEIKSMLDTGQIWIAAVKKCIGYYKNTKEESFLLSAEKYLFIAENLYKKITG